MDLFQKRWTEEISADEIKSFCGNRSFQKEVLDGMGPLLLKYTKQNLSHLYPSDLLERSLSNQSDSTQSENTEKTNEIPGELLRLASLEASSWERFFKDSDYVHSIRSFGYSWIGNYVLWLNSQKHIVKPHRSLVRPPAYENAYYAAVALELLGALFWDLRFRQGLVPRPNSVEENAALGLIREHFARFSHTKTTEVEKALVAAASELYPFLGTGHFLKACDNAGRLIVSLSTPLAALGLSLVFQREQDIKNGLDISDPDYSKEHPLPYQDFAFRSENAVKRAQLLGGFTPLIDSSLLFPGILDLAKRGPNPFNAGEIHAQLHGEGGKMERTYQLHELINKKAN